MLVVLSYDKKYNSLWQIRLDDGTILATYSTRQEALDRLKKEKQNAKG